MYRNGAGTRMARRPRNHPIRRSRGLYITDITATGEIRRRRVCRYFMRGNCHFGSRCRFLHAIEESDEDTDITEEEDDYDDEEYSLSILETSSRVSISSSDSTFELPCSSCDSCKTTKQKQQQKLEKLPPPPPPPPPKPQVTTRIDTAAKSKSNTEPKTTSSVTATTSQLHASAVGTGTGTGTGDDDDDGDGDSSPRWTTVLSRAQKRASKEKILAQAAANATVTTNITGTKTATKTATATVTPSTLTPRTAPPAAAATPTTLNLEPTALDRSKGKTCGICLEVVIEKPARRKRFGILPNCNHIFCLDCIRKWRRAKHFQQDVTKSCPECRIASDYVCPSTFWVDTKQDKEKLLSDYRATLRSIGCKYYKNGRGKCPFGNKCFYKHALPNGQLVDVGNPSVTRPRRQIPTHITSAFIEELNHYFRNLVQNGREVFRFTLRNGERGRNSTDNNSTITTHPEWDFDF